MTDYDDTALLAAWVRDASQEAFAVLARRYAGLLYHAGLRRTGRPELAQEAAQNALAILARKAAGVSAKPSLAAWLHRTTCYEAAKLLRGERRHHEHMKTLHEQPSEPDDIPDPWARAVPVLDVALDALPEADRRVLLHKYFDGWTFEQMAERFGGQSAAWRQRGSRAVDRLRRAFAAKGVVLSTTVIATGLNTSLSQSAPAAVAAALTTAPLTAAGLTWQSLVLHSLQTMNLKQAAITITVALTALVPLGLQYNAIANSRARVAALSSSVEALRTQAVPAAENIARSGRLAMPGTGTQRGAAGVEDGIDLAEWAELFSEGGPGSASEAARTLRAMNKLRALDTDALKNLILAAEQMDLPLVKRSRLIMALAQELGKNSPGSALPVFMRLTAHSDGGERMNVISHAASALRRWTETDPDAAEAWFVAAKASGALESKSLDGGLDFEGLLRTQVVVGLLKSRPGEAEKRLNGMSPQAASMALHDAGVFVESTTIARLAKQLPVNFQTKALSGVVMQMARTDLDAAARFVKASELPPPEVRTLLVSAAGQMGDYQGPGTTDLGVVAARTSWLRREAPEGQAEEAVGAFLATIAANDFPGAVRAWEKEYFREEGPDPVLMGAFARQLAAVSPEAWHHGQTIAEAMPKGAERDRALKELEQHRWSPAEPVSVESASDAVKTPPQPTPAR